MKILLRLFVIVKLFIATPSLGQTSNKEMTPAQELAIRAEVQAQVPKLKQILIKKGLNDVQVEFYIDTFKVEA